MLTNLHSILYLQEGPASKGGPIYEVIKFPAPEGVWNTSNLNKFWFTQQSSNFPSGIPYHKGLKGSKIPKMIDLASTGLRRSASLANKPKEKYGLFDKLSLTVIRACEVANNAHIFITRSNQYIW